MGLFGLLAELFLAVLLLAVIVNCGFQNGSESVGDLRNLEDLGNLENLRNPESRNLNELSLSILNLSKANNATNLINKSIQNTTAAAKNKPQAGISLETQKEPKLGYTSSETVSQETNPKPSQVSKDSSCDCKSFSEKFASKPFLPDFSNFEESWTISKFQSAILEDLQTRSELTDRLQDQLRQLVIGLPLDIAFSTLNYICSTIVDLGVVRSKLVPDMSQMSFLLRTENDCRNTSIRLDRAEDLFQAPGFNPNLPSVLFITGWRTSINSSNSGPVAKAYACRNDTNILILDAANFVDTLYSWSALNTEAIGAYVAKALLRMNASYVTEQLHIVGHSLGAQIAGSAGRTYRQLSNGGILKRLTGLDPANPCFYDGNDLEGLRSGDARFVDIIHSNPGMLGSSRRAGDADFFVQGRIPFKNGCTGLDAIACSHQRAVDYYAESVYPTNELDFLARRCNRYAELLIGRYCQDTRTVMGFAARPTELGLYYVGANGQEPYGQNADLDTYTPSTSECGICD